MSEPANMGSRFRRILILTLALLLIALLIVWWIQQPAPNRNRLALGAGSSAGPIEIVLNPPQEFDGLSRESVYDLRREAVSQYPALLAADYTPSEVVFGQIVDGLPWWGMAGQWYHGNGERSIEGPSEESRFILNPYLLLHAEMYGFSYYGGYGRLEWDPARVDEAALAQDEFPFIPAPDSLRWYAEEARAELHYDISGFLETLNVYLVTPLTVERDGWFDLIPYNARDLNLNWAAIDWAASENIDDKERSEEAAALPHFIHHGSSCAYPGGCNNMSPAFAPLDDLRLVALPARLTVKLWQDRPQAASDPDLVWVILFE